jgi:4-diphosphocytidyl-2-C-methyl-D-erythritol kinase
LTFALTPGPFQILCSDPGCPVDETNLVWRAAERLWSRAGRRGAMPGTVVTIDKHIPRAGGLGGGSSDAVATLRALSALWNVTCEPRAVGALARELGADVPFFLLGGTALGLERGDLLFSLQDLPAKTVVLVTPSFGVSAKDAYTWWDGSDKRPSSVECAINGLPVPGAEMGNDLQSAVAKHHPSIEKLVTRLTDLGAVYAAMSGSGSTVFGLFGLRRQAETAARVLGRDGDGSVRALVTETLGRARYHRLGRPVLAAPRPGRIHLPSAPRSQAHS